MGATAGKAQATAGGPGRTKTLRQGTHQSLPEVVAKRAGCVSVFGRYHRLPKRIEDDYDLKDTVLGSGYNGVVRMAMSKCVEHPLAFAVKAFKLNGITADKRAQLDSEVGVFLGMDHPNVARLFDVYETDEFLHLVMECLEGGELFDRVTERKTYSEQDAADATRQMLLALNYLHSHGIVHRDLKLENFLYDYKNGDHLKLIDFGFSKMWEPNIKMHVSCGTLSYVAPEVLEKSYTKQCDLWSLGVIAFILLAGYMPFSGSEAVQTKNILGGKYTMKKERWGSISEEGINFVQALLQVDPDKRLTAETALEHPWIVHRHKADIEIDAGIVEGLRKFGQASKFRRCCLEMMAWSLSNEERSQVHEYFVSMDKHMQGTITLMDLKQVMVDKFHIPEGETKKVFEALDTTHDDSIHYSDFLAAMVNTRITMHSDLLRSAFRRFDTDNSGFITVEKLRQVLGDTFEGEQVETLIKEAAEGQENQISYAEFVAYLRGTPLDVHEEAVERLIEQEKERRHIARLPDREECPTVPPNGSWMPVQAMLRTHVDSKGKRTPPTSPAKNGTRQDSWTSGISKTGSDVLRRGNKSQVCCAIS